MELSGEYVGPDGKPQQLQVFWDELGDADTLQSLLTGVAQMKELVSEFFGHLTQQGAQDCLAPDKALDGKSLLWNAQPSLQVKCDIKEWKYKDHIFM